MIRPVPRVSRAAQGQPRGTGLPRVRAGDIARQPLPDPGLHRQAAHQGDQLAGVHRVADGLRIGAPDLVEGVVDQLQQPVRPKHRETFVEPIQRRPAQVDRMAVLLFEAQPFGHVVEHEGERAMRMRPRPHPDVGAVSQMPELLIVGGVGLQEQVGQPLPPVVKIRHLRDPAARTQAVEDFAQRGPLRHPARIGLPHLDQGRIEHHQALIAVEDRQADVEMCKGLGHGADEPGQGSLRRQRIGGIDRQAEPRTTRPGGLDHVEGDGLRVAPLSDLEMEPFRLRRAVVHNRRVGMPLLSSRMGRGDGGGVAGLDHTLLDRDLPRRPDGAPLGGSVPC